MPLSSYLYVGPRCHCSGVLPVKEEHQRIYDSTPEDEPRSRLDPYRELILRWRRQGRTYRRILQMLRDDCHLKVAFGTLHEFVQKRSRPRKPDLEIEPATVQHNSQPGKRLTPDERQAQLDFIRSLNSKPVVKEQQPPSGWDLLEPDNVSFRPKGDK